VPKRSATDFAVLQAPQPRALSCLPTVQDERRLAGALEVPLAQVLPDPEQPRKDWEHGEGARRLEELVASIKEFGVLQPLLVREDGVLEGNRTLYRIVAGARRREAASRAGHTHVPVVIRDESQVKVRMLQLIENLHRQDLSPLDEAHAYQELMGIKEVTATALAAELHVSGQRVRDRLRLLVDQVLADAVARRQISATAAREIIQLPDDDLAEFRQRVQAGERLQTNDVARVRARLAADGAVHPRRKIRVFDVPRAIAAPSPVVALRPSLDPPLQDHTSCDPVAVGQDGIRDVAIIPTSEPAQRVDPQRRLAPLLEGLSPEILSRIDHLLEEGEGYKWTCAELRRQLRPYLSPPIAARAT
jgi:ParB/RepB/Spo0J family partition protein